MIERFAPGLDALARPIATLREDPGNARLHDDRNLDAIARSLELFGQQKPIVVMDDGTVIAGNGTLRAAKGLGWKTIACVVTQLDKRAAAAFAVADNRTAELATWNPEVLIATLKELDTSPQMQAAAGFDEGEYRELLKRFDKDTGAATAPAVASPTAREFKYQVIVECADEADQATLIGRLEGEGLKCRALIS